MFRRNRPLEAAARRLFACLVEQSRRPAFYEAAGIPDTLDGRFDLIGLHLFLVLRRLRREPAERQGAEELAQFLFDTTFANMDENLREMGVGDLSVGAKVRQMAQAFYGRAAAYEQALSTADDRALCDALRRNLFGTVVATEKDVSAVAAYLQREDRSLSTLTFADLAGGRLAFGSPPTHE